MALPNCLIDRLILVYLNVVGGWCASVKNDVSERRCYDEEEEEELVEVEEGGTAKGVEGRKQIRPLQSPSTGDSRDLEPRFADLLAVDRILALLTHAPLGSWVLQKRPPALAKHVRLLAHSAL